MYTVHITLVALAAHTGPDSETVKESLSGRECGRSYSHPCEHLIRTSILLSGRLYVLAAQPAGYLAGLGLFRVYKP